MGKKNKVIPTPSNRDPILFFCSPALFVTSKCPQCMDVCLFYIILCKNAVLMLRCDLVAGEFLDVALGPVEMDCQ
jgi:hypothetical protein